MAFKHDWGGFSKGRNFIPQPQSHHWVGHLLTGTQNLQQPDLSFQDTPVTRDSYLVLTQFPDDLTRATPQSKSTPIF